MKKALLPLLRTGDSAQVTIRRSFKTHNSKSKWWFTIIAPQATMALIEELWLGLERKTSWRLQSSLKPPTCVAGLSGNPDQSQQPDGSNQLQPTAIAGTTPIHPASKLLLLVMPLQRWLHLPQLVQPGDNSDPSLITDNLGSSLLDSLLLPNTPLPISNPFLGGLAPPEQEAQVGHH